MKNEQNLLSCIINLFIVKLMAWLTCLSYYENVCTFGVKMAGTVDSLQTALAAFAVPMSSLLFDNINTIRTP